MPTNRNALIRYKTIDNCLQNRFRKWTLNDLIEAVSDALYEYEGIDGVSRRTIQGDIQMMRSDKLGYNAPIIVVDKKYYTYEEADYSITNMPLTENDLEQLAETASFLKQFSGFSHFQELSGMVQKLEDHIYSKITHEAPIIDFEKNENLKGLAHLDILYQAIKKKKVLTITYQSFKAKEANLIIFHAYLLKEFNNRWFLIGVKDNQQSTVTLALDRMIKVEVNKLKRYIPNTSFDPSNFYQHIIGVSVSNKEPEEIQIFIDKRNAPYVLTKPLHHSQKVLKSTELGTVIQVKIIINFEFERLILGFCESMEILSPEYFRKRIQTKLGNAYKQYHPK